MEERSVERVVIQFHVEIKQPFGVEDLVDGMNFLTQRMGLVHIIITSDLKADNVQKIPNWSNNFNGRSRLRFNQSSNAEYGEDW